VCVCLCVCGCVCVCDTRTIIEDVGNDCMGVKLVHIYIVRLAKRCDRNICIHDRDQNISLYVRIRMHVGILHTHITHTHIMHSNVNIPKCKCNVPTCIWKREFVCEVCVCSTLCVCVYHVSVCVYDVCV